MKIITEPTVTIVAATQFFGHPTYLIPDDGTDAEKLGSFAGKGCYDSFSNTGRANVANQEAILEHGHGSVLEHATVSLFIEGITRGLSLELNRHRPFAVSQRSTRYVKEEDSAIVLDPYYAELYTKFNGSNKNPVDATFSGTESKLLVEFLETSKASIDAYQSQVTLLEQLNPNKLTGFDLRKWARGKARNILPHGLETRGTWTMNYRALRWFIEARSDRHAEPEIRRLADSILSVVRPLAPTYFGDFELNAVVDGINEWVPKHHKV